MLVKALKLDQVHIFGDLSMSQFLEKIDFSIERVKFNQLKKTQLKNQTLVTVISLARDGILVESNKEHKEKYQKGEVDQEFYPASTDSIEDYEEYVDQEIPVSTDSTKLYMNMSQINWKSDRREVHSEIVSVVDLTSRITSLTTAILLLF